jgi:mRNA-degrading endonuclease RelE of RelBE toxin-antitoxin system
MAGYKLRFHPQFVNDLEGAIAWYDSKSKVASRKFKAAVKKQLKLIKKSPQLKTIRYDDVRFARVEKFPYSIHYSIDTPDNCVQVYRILSDQRDPHTNWEIS